MSVDYTTGEVHAPSIGPLAAALAKAQSAFPAVTRSKTVRVTTKTGGSYTFAYAPLDSILDAVRKPLVDNGLALVQLIDREALVTILLHESGASLEGRTPIPATVDVQALGSAITYLRRYAIQALLGIAAEEDDDGNGASGNTSQPAARPPRATETAQIRTQPAAAQPSTPAAPQGELTDDDWGGIVTTEGTPVPLGLVTGNGHASALEGLSSRDLFARLEQHGMERKVASDAAKRLFGKDAWKLTELTDEQRGSVWEEVSA